MYALMAVIFVVGYLLIACEHRINIDKAALALLMGVLLWTVLVLGVDHKAIAELPHHLGDIAGILFFLLGAMTIVELVDAHDGFTIITDKIHSCQKVTLLWVLGFITFFLSAVLDNLTSTIVMVSLSRKLIPDARERWFYAGMVVIAANAGGAWSPIGDVTTTMLWIGNQVSTINLVKHLFIPSLVCLLVPLVLMSFKLKGNIHQPAVAADINIPASGSSTATESNVVFALGLGALLFVPVFKTLTHLPPYMGVLLGLAVLWVVTEIMHRNKKSEEKYLLSVSSTLRRIDSTTILFFLGILLAVASLATAGHLLQVAGFLRAHIGNVYVINLVIGLLSAVIDNVPLVAAAMQMYPLASVDQLDQLAVAPEQAQWLQHFVRDGHFWQLLAYCAGTGGSCLIIGSAAGVAAMGMEKMDFFWYLKNISLLALLGYLGGVLVYLVAL